MLAGRTWSDVQVTSALVLLKAVVGRRYCFLGGLATCGWPIVYSTPGLEKPGILQTCGCGADSSRRLKPVFQREKSCVSATCLCSKGNVSALLTVAWGSLYCWQEKAERTQEAQKDGANNIQSFFFLLFHVLFPHIYSKRMAHMALFHSVFLKDPSTLESVIRGACFMQSCLWCWLSGFSMSNKKEVPSFRSLLVLQENGGFSEGHSKGKSRSLEWDFHALYSRVYSYISSAKRSPNKVQHFPLQSSKKTRGVWRCPEEI